MFTGIVTDKGRIKAVETRGDLRVTVATSYDTSTVDLGAGLPGTTASGAAGLPALFDAALVYVPPARTAVLIAGQGFHELSGRIFAMTF